MSPTMKAKQSELHRKNAELEALLATECPDPAAVKALDGECETLLTEVKQLQSDEAALEETRVKTAERSRLFTEPAHPLSFGGDTASAEGAAKSAGRIFAKPPNVKVKNFVTDEYGTAHEKAYGMGQWLLASFGLSEKAVEFCKAHDIPYGIKAQSENDNLAGGVLVAPQYVPEVIRIIESYGVIRRFARDRKMTSDTMNIPRRTGGVTAYHTSQNKEINESQMGWDAVNLTADKIAVLTKVPTELNEDAVIGMADSVMEEIGIAFAYREDLDAFLGDGTSTYGRVLGILPKLQKSVTDAGGTWATDAHKIYNPSIVVASGKTFATIARTDFTRCLGAIHQAADVQGACRWYCNRTFYFNVMIEIALAAGGVTLGEMTNGPSGEPMFLGYPVTFVQVMPKVEAADTIFALFGNLRLSSDFGDRRAITLALSEHANFAADQLTIRGTERYDINHHDIGTASSTAANRVQSPIAALCFKN